MTPHPFRRHGRPRKPIPFRRGVAILPSVFTLANNALGDAAQRGWLMLFELLQQRGDKAAFDSLTIEYVLRFESSPPAWIEYKDEGPMVAPAGAPKPSGSPVISLPGGVDAGVVKHLEQLKQQSQLHQSITLDASNVRSVDMVGAELLLRVINAFKRASHELIVMGADQLVTPLRAAVEAGRRDPSDAVWMLLLEIFRLLNRQQSPTPAIPTSKTLAPT